MAVLGDDQAADLRRRIVEVGAFTGIEAFPQKDDPSNRIFLEAKLSTAIFTVVKTTSSSAATQSFTSRVHPGRLIELSSPSLLLSTQSIPLYDPENFTIVSCSQQDWDLAIRLIQSGRMERLRTYCTSFQGEVNETIEGQRGNLSDDRAEGKLVLRGSNVCLYVLRPASQGKSLFLREARFLDGKSQGAKAFHSREARVGFQRSSPQNNFRRVVSSRIAPNNYCFDTISYIPSSKSLLPIGFIVALLNSKLIDWYFRLGSTNSKVNEYQFNNLPCPRFAEDDDRTARSLHKESVNALNAGDFDRILQLFESDFQAAPFSGALRDLVVVIIEKIEVIEAERGDIPRSARSALDPKAQPFQDLVDKLFFKMAGFTESEYVAIEERLSHML